MSSTALLQPATHVNHVLTRGNVVVNATLAVIAKLLFHAKHGQRCLVSEQLLHWGGGGGRAQLVVVSRAAVALEGGRDG